MPKEFIQAKTLHSNSASISDYEFPERVVGSVAINVLQGTGPEVKLPDNPLPDTKTETPAPVPIIVTNPEKVIEYVNISSPISGSVVDNKDGTITFYA